LSSRDAEPNKTSKEYTLIVGLLLISLLMIGVFVATFYVTEKAIETERDIDQSHEFLLQLHDCLGWLAAAESSVRNYVASGDESSLTLYRRANKNVTRHLQVVNALLRDSEGGKALAQLDEEIERIRNCMDQGLIVYKEKGPVAADAELRGRKGALLIMDVETIAHAETERELKKLHDLIKQSEVVSKRAFVILSFFGLLSLIVFTFLAKRLLQYLHERIQAQSALERLNLELEQRVRDRTKELRDANRELEAFSYSASHDLQSPLRIVTGFSNALLEDYGQKLEPEAQRYLHTIARYTSSMGRLIEDLLAFSRAGRQEIRHNDIDVNKLVASILEELKPVIGARKIRFNIDSVPRISGDESLVRQVLWNLFSNAVKFTRNREDAEISFGCKSENGENIYFVKDNGVGFDMQFIADLFSPFRRLHTAEEFEGTGIGLALVERIIERHGGRVWAEGEVNKGATIYFGLHATKSLVHA
jgi:signal transduction histidine kinase